MSKRVFKTELDAVNNSLQSQVNNSISKTIVDAKGDIVTASAADTPIRLAVGTNEHRLVADSATTSGLKYVADTTNYAVGAKGDLLVGTAADTVTNLAVGTNGHVLTADSATTSGLKWAAVAAGGKVLQVVQATHSSEVSTTSTTFTDTSLSASITPSSTSSKVLVLVSQPFYATRNSDECGGHSQLVRGSTVLAEHGPRLAYVRQTGASLTEAGTIDNYIYLDSPNTTSSTTYKTQMRVKNAVDSSTIRASNDGNLSSIILLEIGA